MPGANGIPLANTPFGKGSTRMGTDIIKGKDLAALPEQGDFLAAGLDPFAGVFRDFIECRNSDKFGHRCVRISKNMDKRNILMVAASETDANLYYATHFIAPDPFAFVQIRGKKYLLMNDLEMGRAKKQAHVDQVFSLSKLAAGYQRKHAARPGYVDLIADFLKERRAQKLVVPDNFPVAFADALRKRKLLLSVQAPPFFQERTMKRPEEVRAVRKAIGHTEKAIRAAIEVMRKSVIKRGRLYYHGNVLTSEAIKKVINVSLMEDGCIASHSIVACGLQCVDPHDEGSGPLYANQSIIMDIFPRDGHSRYFADISRTVVRGKASKKLKAMFDAVLHGQQIAFSAIRDGVDSSVIHADIQKYFEKLGFRTGLQNGRMQGFFHGTGHGLGLDIHEDPRISMGKCILRSGQIVTVEPGLYYEDAGGVRIEDDVLVTKKGCINLVRLPKILEL